MSKRKTKEEFILDAKEKHGNKYDYSLMDYPKNNKTKIIIKCNICGKTFQQTPHDHLSGYGCPYCAKNKRLTTEEFINRARDVHKNKYDYSASVYKNRETKSKIICKKHGEFLQTPHNHLNGQGCPRCKAENISKRCRWTTKKFIEKAKAVHGDKYDYSKTEYVDTKTKVCIICPKHGEFWQTPHVHITGHGCPYCRQSIIEEGMANFLDKNNVEYYRQKTFEWLFNKKSLKLDFYIPKYNAAIECHGIQHFEPCDFSNGGGLNAEEEFLKTVERDEVKNKICDENGIKLFYFSNLKKDYKYTLYNNKEKLLNDIKNEKL